MSSGNDHEHARSSKVKLGLPLNDYDRDMFYTFGPRGYTDYPFDSEQAA
jgi:hypothetical protein